jgi:hypothetical protein
VSRGRVLWPTVATAVVLAGGALYLLIISAAISEQARLYPQIFLVATLGGSIALGAEALLRGRRPPGATPARVPGGAPDQDPDRQGWPRYLALVLYLLVLNPLGFVVATTGVLTAVLLWLRVPATRAVPLAAAGVLVIFVIFRTAMYVSLPAGPVDIYLLELLYSG